jgi:ParG
MAPGRIAVGFWDGCWAVRLRDSVRLAAVPGSFQSTYRGWRCVNVLSPIAAALDHPDHWRRILTITYPHRSEREGVSRIKKEGTGIKRVNINLEVNLHNAFKAATAAQGIDMTTVLQQFIENYVAKHGSVTPQKNSRRV